MKLAGIRDEMSNGLHEWMSDPRNPKDRKLTTDYKKHRNKILSKSLSNFHGVVGANTFTNKKRSLGDTQTFSLTKLN